METGEFFEGKLGGVLKAISEAGREISERIKTADTGKAGTKNVYGEEQIGMDILAEQILQSHLKKSGLVGWVGSEELEGLVQIGNSGYTVVYDPLDGSSLADVNLSVGTIFGVFEDKDFIGKTCEDMVAAGFIVYGPRTTLVLSVKNGAHEYQLNSKGEWERTHSNLQVGEGKMFAPGNLRCVTERKDYLKLVNWWMEQEYTLRYSGGMVPDINQILIKGKGIFSYPGYGKYPDGKLRLLFECAPMAFVMEQAGGAASNGSIRILDIPIQSFSQRSPIYIGSKAEVKRCEDQLIVKQ